MISKISIHNQICNKFNTEHVSSKYTVNKEVDYSETVSIWDFFARAFVPTEAAEATGVGSTHMRGSSQSQQEGLTCEKKEKVSSLAAGEGCAKGWSAELCASKGSRSPPSTTLASPAKRPPLVSPTENVLQPASTPPKKRGGPRIGRKALF